MKKIYLGDPHLHHTPFILLNHSWGRSPPPPHTLHPTQPLISPPPPHILLNHSWGRSPPPPHILHPTPPPPHTLHPTQPLMGPIPTSTTHPSSYSTTPGADPHLHHTPFILLNHSWGRSPPPPHTLHPTQPLMGPIPISTTHPSSYSTTPGADPHLHHTPFILLNHSWGRSPPPPHTLHPTQPLLGPIPTSTTHPSSYSTTQQKINCFYLGQMLSKDYIALKGLYIFSVPPEIALDNL